MELADAIARRRMTRSFRPDPLPSALVEQVLAAVVRGPSAGFSQGLDLVVLEAPDERGRFWELTADADWRRTPAAEGLLAAPVLAIIVSRPAAYVERYARPDKAGSGLAGLPPESWPVPYWYLDAGAGVMLVLLSAAQAGLGALLFRIRLQEEALRSVLGIPREALVLGVIALGWPGEDGPSGSSRHIPARTPSEALHRGRW